MSEHHVESDKEVDMTEMPFELAARSTLQSIASDIWAFFDRQRERLEVRRMHRDARDAFLNMLTLEDKILDDIGVTREDVKWAASLPVEVNASRALFARARRRKTGTLLPPNS